MIVNKYLPQLLPLATAPTLTPAPVTNPPHSCPSSFLLPLPPPLLWLLHLAIALAPTPAPAHTICPFPSSYLLPLPQLLPLPRLLPLVPVPAPTPCLSQLLPLATASALS